MAQSNGKADISKRWHREIKETVNKYNFQLEETFDSILTSNARHKCNFCGQGLRYVAVISGDLLTASNSLPSSQKYNIGLDCLGLVLGSSWAGYGEAEKQIRVLKTAAAIETRRVKYAEKYPKMIAWLTEVIELTNNDFLRGMLSVLTSGSTVFTTKMRDAVKKCAADKKRYDLTKLRKQGERIKEILGNIQYLIDMIKEVDVLADDATNSTLDFVQSIYNFAERTNYITEAQSNGLKKVRERFVERKKKWAGLKREYIKRCEIPF